MWGVYSTSEESNMNGGWITRTLPAMMRKQRRTESHVRGLLRITLSIKTLNKGDVKLTTIRSPIGIRGTAARKPKLEEETQKPYRANNNRVGRLSFPFSVC